MESLQTLFKLGGNLVRADLPKEDLRDMAYLGFSRDLPPGRLEQFIDVGQLFSVVHQMLPSHAQGFDRDFEVRAHAARRFWRALNGRAAGPAFHQLTSQRRERLALALCALDAWAAGRTYREIASVLFGAKRIPERAWKTHDLRNRTIRLVQSGIALMRGGYRQLLRPSRRKK